MTLKLNRRAFLQALIGMGAAVVLPARATARQVDPVWKSLLASLWHFEVDDHGTILESDAVTPRINADVYDIWVEGLDTPQDLVREVECHDELRRRFVHLAGCARDEALHDAEDSDDPAARRAARRLLALIEDPDRDWADWVLTSGAQALPGFQAHIAEWLQQGVDWRQMEFWPAGWSAQGGALRFFQGLDNEVLDELGVVIVEGEHPGSSDYAAELRNDIAQANASATLLGLPFRFRHEDEAGPATARQIGR